MMALEWVLRRTGSRRTAVTYEELAGSVTAAAGSVGGVGVEQRGFEGAQARGSRVP
jgi:hypothetical protein